MDRAYATVLVGTLASLVVIAVSFVGGSVPAALSTLLFLVPLSLYLLTRDPDSIAS